MLLIFDNCVILNMDNIVSISAEEHSDNEAKILIITTAIEFIPSITYSHYDSYIMNFKIEKKKWVELLEAIQNDKKVFVL